MSIIIGLCGYKRTGKTTVAEILTDVHGYHHDSFAAPLREFACSVLGINMEELEKDKEAPVGWLDGKTPRYMMQTIGTEWGRDMIHPELWIRSLAVRIAPALAYGKNVVVSDVRFPNEAEMIRNLGGHIVRVTRPGMTRGDHPSEAQVDAIAADFEFPNEGSLGSIIEAVRRLDARLQ